MKPTRAGRVGERGSWGVGERESGGVGVWEYGSIGVWEVRTLNSHAATLPLSLSPTPPLFPSLTSSEVEPQRRIWKVGLIELPIPEPFLEVEILIPDDPISSVVELHRDPSFGRLELKGVRTDQQGR